VVEAGKPKGQEGTFGAAGSSRTKINFSPFQAARLGPPADCGCGSGLEEESVSLGVTVSGCCFAVRWATCSSKQWATHRRQTVCGEIRRICRQSSAWYYYYYYCPSLFFPPPPPPSPSAQSGSPPKLRVATFARICARRGRPRFRWLLAAANLI